ncbi:GNAT family N-acetyltransferase [Dongia sp.]|uniref:GNAT family N-acetyltransferase n=1 Tax=Dongia sp. TaxID=1977262 RepID=UPI0035B4DA5F
MWINDIYIRRAQMTDIVALRAMQERSMRIIGRAYYAEDVLETFLRKISTMDDAVVAEGHYFVAIDIAGNYVGSGGWSRRAPGYSAHGESASLAPDSRVDNALVRSVFVDPDRARAGIGSGLMRHIEQDAYRLGIRDLRLMATLSGVDFYHARGYRSTGGGQIDLGDNASFGYVDMVKCLADEDVAARVAS